MRGGALPSALLYAALGLAVAFAPRRVWWSSLIALVSISVVFVFVPLPRMWQEEVFLGCWVSVAASALMVHMPRGLSSRAALALSINAGFWSGCVIAFAGSPVDLFASLPCVLIVVPTTWIVKRWRAPIIPKTVASWLVAVAALATLLQLLPLTPGYLPDHMD